MKTIENKNLITKMKGEIKQKTNIIENISKENENMKTEICSLKKLLSERSTNNFTDDVKQLFE